jgi:hypothetical protein
MSRATAGTARARPRHHADRIDRLASTRSWPAELLERLMPRTGRRSASASRACRASARARSSSTRHALTGTGHRSRCSRSTRRAASAAGASWATRRAWRALSSDDQRLRAPFARAPARSAGSRAKTRESMLVCEAGGFDVVLVETVGVGQSETVVRGMTDLFWRSCCPARATSSRGSSGGCSNSSTRSRSTKPTARPRSARPVLLRRRSSQRRCRGRHACGNGGDVRLDAAPRCRASVQNSRSPSRRAQRPARLAGHTRRRA